jgi:hypothetical protein
VLLSIRQALHMTMQRAARLGGHVGKPVVDRLKRRIDRLIQAALAERGSNAPLHSFRRHWRIRRHVFGE